MSRWMVPSELHRRYAKQVVERIARCPFFRFERPCHECVTDAAVDFMRFHEEMESARQTGDPTNSSSYATPTNGSTEPEDAE